MNVSCIIALVKITPEILFLVFLIKRMNFPIVLIVMGICVQHSYQANIADKLDFTEESKETVTHTMKSPKIQGVRVTVDTTNLKGSAGLSYFFKYIYLTFKLYDAHASFTARYIIKLLRKKKILN